MEVEAWAKKAMGAGGTVYRRPERKDGWIYGCGFSDPDGHRWSVLCVDESKMPKANRRQIGSAVRILNYAK